MSHNESEKDRTLRRIRKEAVGRYFSRNSIRLWSFLLTFLICAGFSFVRIASSGTVASHAVLDYEVGQIADATIEAKVSLPASIGDPVEVKKNEVIIRKGFPVTREAYDKLQKMASSPLYIDYIAFLSSLLYLFLVTLLFYFLFSLTTKEERGRMLLNALGPDREPYLQMLLLDCISFVLIYAFCSILPVFMGMSQGQLLLILPVTLCIMLASIIFGFENALYLSFVISLAAMDAFGYKLFIPIYMLASSVLATRLVIGVSDRNRMVLVSIGVSVADLLSCLIISIIYNAQIPEIWRQIWKLSLFASLNGFVSGLLCMGVITPLELLMNTSSVFRLTDLDNTNAKIFERMRKDAPGTFAHSEAVAELAEGACRSLGLNSRLAKVAGLYHDIGKIENPEYFTENQNGENRHDNLKASLSFTIIKGHVRRGVEIAKKEYLPKSVITLISEHHGNQVIEWFYKKAQDEQRAKIIEDCLAAGKSREEAENEAKNLVLSDVDFRYDDCRPSSKESAILMLADTVQAASKSWESCSYSAIEVKISELIKHKIDDDQMAKCNLSFKDLNVIQQSFLDTTWATFHRRTKYPSQIAAEEKQVAEKASLEKSQAESGRPLAQDEKSVETAEKSSGDSQRGEISPSKAKTKVRKSPSKTSKNSELSSKKSESSGAKKKSSKDGKKEVKKDGK